MAAHPPHQSYHAALVLDVHEIDDAVCTCIRENVGIVTKRLRADNGTITLSVERPGVSGDLKKVAVLVIPSDSPHLPVITSIHEATSAGSAAGAARAPRHRQVAPRAYGGTRAQLAHGGTRAQLAHGGAPGAPERPVLSDQFLGIQAIHRCPGDYVLVVVDKIKVTLACRTASILSGTECTRSARHRQVAPEAYGGTRPQGAHQAVDDLIDSAIGRLIMLAGFGYFLGNLRLKSFGYTHAGDIRVIDLVSQVTEPTNYIEEAREVLVADAIRIATNTMNDQELASFTAILRPEIVLLPDDIDTSNVEFHWNSGGVYTSQDRISLVMDPGVFKCIREHGWRIINYLGCGGYSLAFEVKNARDVSAVALVFANNMTCAVLPDEVGRIRKVKRAQDTGKLSTEYTARVFATFTCPLRVTQDPRYCPNQDVPTFVTIEEQVSTGFHDLMDAVIHPKHEVLCMEADAVYEEARRVITTRGFAQYKQEYPELYALIDDLVPFVLEMNRVLHMLAATGWYHDDAHFGNWVVRDNGQIVLIDLDTLKYTGHSDGEIDATVSLWSVSSVVFAEALRPNSQEMENFMDFIVTHIYHNTRKFHMNTRRGTFLEFIPRSEWPEKYRTWGDNLGAPVRELRSRTQSPPVRELRSRTQSPPVRELRSRTPSPPGDSPCAGSACVPLSPTGDPPCASFARVPTQAPEAFRGHAPGGRAPGAQLAHQGARARRASTRGSPVGDSAQASPALGLEHVDGPMVPLDFLKDVEANSILYTDALANHIRNIGNIRMLFDPTGAPGAHDTPSPRARARPRPEGAHRAPRAYGSTQAKPAHQSTEAPDVFTMTHPDVMEVLMSQAGVTPRSRGRNIFGHLSRITPEHMDPILESEQFGKHVQTYGFMKAYWSIWKDRYLGNEIRRALTLRAGFKYIKMLVFANIDEFVTQLESVADLQERTDYYTNVGRLMRTGHNALRDLQYIAALLRASRDKDRIIDDILTTKYACNILGILRPDIQVDS
jgi:hypothetical protein